MPGQFNDKLKAEYNPPFKWKLVSPLSFTSDEITDDDAFVLKRIDMENDFSKDGTIGYTVTAPIGFETNLASVPRLFWNIMSPWDIARSAVIHDFLYWNCAKAYPKLLHNDSDIGELTWRDARKISDKIFRLAMRCSEPNVPAWKIGTAYYAVRMFGGKPARTIDGAEK